MATTKNSVKPATAIPEAPKTEAPVPVQKATRKVFIRSEYEGQKTKMFSINGVPLEIPVDQEAEVPEDFAKLVDNYHAAKKESVDYRLKNEQYVRSLMRG